MELTFVQLAILGLVATVIVGILNLLAEKGGIHLARGWVTAILFVIAMILSFFWQPVALPAFPVWAGDPAVFALALLTFTGTLASAAGVVVGFATVIYNWLVKKVYDRLARVAVQGKFYEKARRPKR
jgi:uncharacterized membrane protein